MGALISAGHAAAVVPPPYYRTNVAYGDGPQRVLDLGVPAAGGSARPAVVFIHGGGWAAGSKDDWRDALPRIVRQGWVAFSIDYRLGPAARFPSAVADTFSALRWIRRNASRFGVDPKRVAVVGDSAGGHLALMAATKGAVHPETRVAAAVSLSGPTDLAALVRTAYPPLQAVTVDFVGCRPRRCPARYASVSPVALVDASTAPIFLVNATREIVPLDQATRMASRLRGAGITYELVVYEGSGHGRDFDRVTWDRVRRFLERHLH